MLMIKEYKILGRLITFHFGLNMMIFTMIIEYRPTKPYVGLGSGHYLRQGEEWRIEGGT